MTRAIIVAGLATGAALGQAGGMVGPGSLQNLSWALSSVGLVTGCLLLGIRWARAGNDLVAAGFATLAIGEIMIWAGGPVTHSGGRASFAGGVLFYVPALALICVPRGLPTALRVLGGAAALPWTAYAFSFLTGRDPSPSGTIAIVGYFLLTAAVIGWIVVVVKQRAVE